MDNINNGVFCQEKRSSNASPNSCHRISECPICSEVCVNHLHYGGMSCYSCKAFFRRSVTAPRKKIVKCKRGDGKCNLRLHLRNNCPHCRLMKCLSTGMREELVLSKYPRHEKQIPHQKSKSFIKAIEPLTLETMTDIINEETLILTLKPMMNLMCVPSRLVSELDRKIKRYTGNLNPDIFLVSQIELAFLTSKQSLTYFMNQIIKHYQQHEEMPTQGKIFSILQEYFVKFMVVFLQNCTCFQSIPIASQTMLLRKDLFRKNISELSILMVTMSFDREDQIFRWGLGNKSEEETEYILQFSEENVIDFLDISVLRNLLKVSNTVSEMDIPEHLLILLILIIVFSRDGVNMEGQLAIDTARGYYLHLLYRYLKLINQQSSKINASLHSVLKTVKDCAEEIRSQLVGNFFL